VAGMVLAERVILWLLMVDLPSLGLSLTHGIVTVAIYPCRRCGLEIPLRTA
jgi:hypothetical protein